MQTALVTDWQIDGTDLVKGDDTKIGFLGDATDDTKRVFALKSISMFSLLGNVDIPLNADSLND